MKLLKRLRYTFFYGNIWIASGAAFSCWQTAVVLQLELAPLLVVFVFCATLFSYNFDRYTERLAFSESYQTRHQWLFDHRKELAFFTILPGVAWVILCFWLPMPVLIWLIHLGLISVGYSVPLWKMKNGERFALRKIGLTKALFVAYVFAAVGVGLPVVWSGYAFDSRFLIEFFARFCFLLALCIPFDLRDEPIDRSHGMLTLPVLLGPTNAMKLAYFLLAIQALLLAFYLPAIPLVLLVVSLLYAAYAMFNAVKKGHDMAYSAGIDGAIVLQALLMGIGFAL
jgi:hypothetical protein